MSVITALTAQNTKGVSGIFEVTPAFVAQQLDSIFEDMGADVVKIGMLANADVIEAVAARLLHHNVHNIPIVLDPVMVAKGGACLLPAAALRALQTKLVPLCSIITPNLEEAQLLLQFCSSSAGDTNEPRSQRQPLQPISTVHEMRQTAKRLYEALHGGPRYVLVKGGHLALLRHVEESLHGGEDEDDMAVVDVLYDGKEDRFVELGARRYRTGNTHGTGCTLASAIAANLAVLLRKKRGEDGEEVMEEAVRAAKRYVAGAIEDSFYREAIGKGHGPLDHFYDVRQ
ncbi:DNA-directed DNA polymerase alpha catalytic subunit pol1 [Balamuthia mandrillaris]